MASEARPKSESIWPRCARVHPPISDGKKKKGRGSPTRNLFPTCQDDSARAVGAHPDDYVDVVGPAWCREKKNHRMDAGTQWSQTIPPFFPSFFPSFLLFVRNPPLGIVRNVHETRPRICHGPDGDRTERESCLSRAGNNNRSVYILAGTANRRLLISHPYYPPRIPDQPRIDRNSLLSLSVIHCHEFVILTLVPSSYLFDDRKVNNALFALSGIFDRTNFS